MSAARHGTPERGTRSAAIRSEWHPVPDKEQFPESCLNTTKNRIRA